MFVRTVILALLAAPALASDLQVPATVLSVYDGDTFTVEAEIRPHPAPNRTASAIANEILKAKQAR